MVAVQFVPQNAKSLIIDGSCPKCKHKLKVQVNLEKNVALEEGAIAYPVSTDSTDCPKCSEKINPVSFRQQIELQFGKKVVE